MRGTGRAYAAGTVVNAISAKKGCAFALDLKVTVRAREAEEDAVRTDVEDTSLVERCVDVVREHVDAEDARFRIEIESEIPVAVGLASSSAVSNAVVEALLRALGREPEPLEVVRLGVEASLRAGVTATGAYDDACASFLGGIVLTLNDERRIVDVREPPYDHAVVLLPGGRVETREVDVERLERVAPVAEAAFERALVGDYRSAMLINSSAYCPLLGHDLDPVLDALEAGASAAGLSGTGPAYVALCETRSDAEAVEEAWEDVGKTLRTRVVGLERVGGAQAQDR
ncbi:shikimate kinase [Methanopyrus sp.]